MADYLRDELGKLLNQHDEQRRVVLAREQKVKDDDALFVAGFADLRRSVIRPAFETAAAMLAERGHKVTIAEQEFSVGAGAKVTEAEISLRIVVSGAKEVNARILDQHPALQQDGLDQRRQADRGQNGHLRAGEYRPPPRRGGARQVRRRHRRRLGNL